MDPRLPARLVLEFRVVIEGCLTNMPWCFRASINASSCWSAYAAGAVEMHTTIAAAIAGRAANADRVVLLLVRTVQLFAVVRRGA